MSAEQLRRPRVCFLAISWILVAAAASAFHARGLEQPAAPQLNHKSPSLEERIRLETKAIEEHGLLRHLALTAARTAMLEAQLQEIEEKLCVQDCEIAGATSSAVKAHSRISNIRLKIAGTSQGEFICAQQHVEAGDNLKFMYGSRDGTSCNVTNINYYKELALDIPKR